MSGSSSKALWLAASMVFSSSMPLLATSACSDSETPARLTEKRIIGKQGGSLQVGVASLDVPAGALSKDTELRISEFPTIGAAALADSPSGAEAVSPVIALEPHGLEFNAAVQVEIGYDTPSEGVGSLGVAGLADEQDKTWGPVEGAMFEQGVAKFEVEHFSYYAVFDLEDELFDEWHGNEATLCAVDEHVVDGACASCPSGTTNEADDDPSGANSTCDAILCEADQHVVDNECVSCPEGTSNLAEDDASGMDTDCDAMLCPSNQHVVDNACVLCPEGATNAAGDDPSGADSTCDATLCEADQHVVDNECVSCPEGLTNAAGDDASGTDTICDDACAAVFGVSCSEFEEGYIKASNTGAEDRFGHSVALSGDTLAVGAPYEDSSATGIDGDQTDDSVADSGAVYVFTRTAGVWSQQAYLKASNTDAEDRFGAAIALSGDTLAVGARNEDSSATGINGDQNDDSAEQSGAVYVFTRAAGAWSQQAYLKASNVGAGDIFGCSVDLSSDTLVVGALQEDSAATGVGGNQSDNSAAQSGAAYVFTRSAGMWSQQAYLKASNTGSYDHFGESVAISADTVAVGAPNEDSSPTGVGDAGLNSGAVYVFVRSGGSWSHQALVKASNPGGDEFGEVVAVSGDTLAVGAPGDDGAASGVDGDPTDDPQTSGSGAAYVFTRSDGAWNQQAYLKASNPGQYDQFGDSLALEGDTLAIGAKGESSTATGINGDEADDSADGSGAVYVFTRDLGEWRQQAYVKSSNTRLSQSFGQALALTATTLAVGVPLESSGSTGVDGEQADTGAIWSGAAYARRIAP